MSEPLTFVTWIWTEPGHTRKFIPQYMNVLRSMLQRHYKAPHRVVCITDNAKGLHKDIEVLPLPATFDGVKNPAGARFPSCYRRLWNFSREAHYALGPRIVALDVDVIITGDLVPLLDRSEDFVGWTDPRESWSNKIAGGLYYHRTGTLTHVWETFDPSTSPNEAKRCGVNGSDQSWLSYQLYPPQGSFGIKDGVYSIKWIEQKRQMPLKTARIISTPGRLKPWHYDLQRLHPWIKRHWC